MKKLLTRVDLHIKRFSWLYTLIGLAIGVGALIYAIWVANHPVKLPQKELTCTLEYAQSMVLKTAEDSGIQVLYDGVEVQNPVISSILISNTGEYAISNADFKKPFIIYMKDSEQVLNYNINRATNAFIMQEVLDNTEIVENMIIIKNFMINPGESFGISIVTNKSPGTISYGYRLDGISNVNIVNNNSPLIVLRKPPNLLPIIFFIGLLFIGCLIALGYFLAGYFYTKDICHKLEKILLNYPQQNPCTTGVEKSSSDDRCKAEQDMYNKLGS